MSFYKELTTCTRPVNMINIMAGGFDPPPEKENSNLCLGQAMRDSCDCTNQ